MHLGCSNKLDELHAQNQLVSFWLARLQQALGCATSRNIRESLVAGRRVFVFMFVLLVEVEAGVVTVAAAKSVLSSLLAVLCGGRLAYRTASAVQQDLVHCPSGRLFVASESGRPPPLYIGHFGLCPHTH